MQSQALSMADAIVSHILEEDGCPVGVVSGTSDSNPTVESQATEEMKRCPPHCQKIVVVRAGLTPSQTGCSRARSLFEVLKPTDIVVVGREPASVRETGQARQLMAHDHHHMDTVLGVWTESDTIEYQCDEPFAIVGVNRAGWKIHGAPENPFGHGDVEYIAQKRRRSANEKPIWVWTSGFLPASANNQQYKMTFRIDGQDIDPDIVCGNPPPSP